MVTRFLEKYPKVELVQHADDHSVDIVADRFDFAIRAYSGTLPDSTMVQRPLAEAPWNERRHARLHRAHHRGLSPRAPAGLNRGAGPLPSRGSDRLRGPAFPLDEVFHGSTRESDVARCPGRSLSRLCAAAPRVPGRPGGPGRVLGRQPVRGHPVCPQESQALRLLGLPDGRRSPWFEHNPLADSILFLDDPKQHGRLRGLISRSFVSSSIAQLEPGLRATAEELTTRLLERRTVDFVEDFALPMSASTIGRFLNLDPALNSHFKQWSDDQVAISASQPGDTELLARCRRSVSETEQYLGGLIAQRRAAPAGDLVSQLLQARPEGGPLTDPELMGFLFLLLVAGLETTMHLMGHSVRLLAEHPEVLSKLRADPSLIPSFIEETLRFEPPSHGVMRICTEPTTLGGVSLPAGSLLLLLLGSALRDERYCPDGDLFRLDRPEMMSHMAFGQGMHFCLGAPLARMETRVALEALLSRCERLTLSPAPLSWNFSLTVRGVRSLPRTFAPDTSGGAQTRKGRAGARSLAGASLSVRRGRGERLHSPLPVQPTSG